VQRQNCGTKQSNSATAIAVVAQLNSDITRSLSGGPEFFYKNKRNLFAVGSLVPPRILHLFHYAENVVQRIVLGSIEKAQREEARCVCPTLGPTQGIYLLLSQWPAQI
jgi:hypothetical protein